MDKEEFLAKHTFNDQGLEQRRRVYDTLTQDKAQEPHRTAKLLAMLVEVLEQQEILDGSTIDQMLIDVVQ